MCGSSKPQAPDPAQTANAQYGYNKTAMQDTLKANTLNQSGPLGSVTWQRDANGMPTGQNISLSPDVQAWLNNQFGLASGVGNAALGQVSNLPGSPFSLSNIPSTSDIAQGLYKQSADLLKPQFNEQTNAVEVNLANRGLPVGSEAYNLEKNRLERSQDAAMTNAANNATAAAGQEQQRQIGNALTQYMLPYQQLSSLESLIPKFSLPDFQKPPTVQTASPDYTSTVNNNYAQEMKDYENQQKGLWSGVSGIGSALIGAKPWDWSIWSDENLKEDRSPADGESILMILRGMPVDDYRYKDEAQEALGLPENRTGPMAQDWQQSFPEGSDGHRIDIADVLGKALAAIKALDARTSGNASNAAEAD